MEPLHFKIPRLNEETVRVESWNLSYFYDPVHFHEEFQITYVTEGEGTLFVGDSIKNFSAGELFFFGKDLPHVLRNDDSYYCGNPNKHARAISLFFSQDIVKKMILDIPESMAVRRLIDYSIYGIRLSGKSAYKVFEIMEVMKKCDGFEKVIALLKILDDISANGNLEFLSSDGVQLKSVSEDIPKINKVFDYVRNRFQERITLEEIAGLVYMSPTAFCRFFKNKTLKTFSRFLIEVRIGNACRLLHEGNFNTTECCYECGFNNISNFHRHFKSVTGMSPGEYKRRISVKTEDLVRSFVPNTHPILEL